jgi:protein-S-isoprenylcysteine O-methyltransferase Ste14
MVPRRLEDSASEDSPRVFLPPPLGLGLLLFLAWSFERQFPTSFEFLGGFWLGVRFLAWVLLALGLALDAAALVCFWLERTNPLPFRPAKAFVVRGPYRWTRNPMYLGMLLTGAALSLLLDSIWMIWATIPFFVWLDRWVIPREERYLERRFGEDYATYCQRVPRWLGGFRKHWEEPERGAIKERGESRLGARGSAEVTRKTARARGSKRPGWLSRS